MLPTPAALLGRYLTVKNGDIRTRKPSNHKFKIRYFIKWLERNVNPDDFTAHTSESITLHGSFNIDDAVASMLIEGSIIQVNGTDVYVSCTQII